MKSLITCDMEKENKQDKLLSQTRRLKGLSIIILNK